MDQIIKLIEHIITQWGDIDQDCFEEIFEILELEYKTKTDFHSEEITYFFKGPNHKKGYIFDFNGLNNTQALISLKEVIINEVIVNGEQHG